MFIERKRPIWYIAKNIALNINVENIVKFKYRKIDKFNVFISILSKKYSDISKRKSIYRAFSSNLEQYRLHSYFSAIPSLYTSDNSSNNGRYTLRICVFYSSKCKGKLYFNFMYYLQCCHIYYFTFSLFIV